MHYYICAMVSCVGNKVHHLKQQPTPPTLFSQSPHWRCQLPQLAVPHSSNITLWVTSRALAHSRSFDHNSFTESTTLKVRVFPAKIQSRERTKQPSLSGTHFSSASRCSTLSPDYCSSELRKE